MLVVSRLVVLQRNMHLLANTLQETTVGLIPNFELNI